MSRHRFQITKITKACVSLRLCALCIFITAETTLDAAKQTNFLFFLVDDMGWADIGANGSTFHETPNIDRLAARGVRLASYYTNPICSPSRATIMSGRYTIRTGIQHSCYSANQATGLPLSERTLANALADEGYENWALGKW